MSSENLFETIRRSRPSDREALVEIWLKSVRATHHFLSEADISALLPAVKELMASNIEIWVLEAGDQLPAGFLILSEANVEALFLAPEHFRKGGGRKLIRHAEKLMGKLSVEVNEQNPEAVRFYEACGFSIVGRSELDSAGRPFPLLQMRQLATGSPGP